MGLFSRLRGIFSREEKPSEIVSEVIAEVGEPELEVIWQDIAEELDAESDLDSAHEFENFAHDGNGLELFQAGWIDSDVDEETRQSARDEFFELMEAYDISRDEFDWDAWRDWYEGE